MPFPDAVTVRGAGGEVDPVVAHGAISAEWLEFTNARFFDECVVACLAVGRETVRVLFSTR